MRKLVILSLLMLTFSNVQAQSKMDQDRNAIRGLAGCYKVKFQFAETFPTDKSYEPHKPYFSGGLEWVGIIEETPEKIVLQHLLIVGDGMIIKHWREDWMYQNTSIRQYDKDHTWKSTTHPVSAVQGQWTQKVFQVDDGPRYEASGTWFHDDGKSVWEATSDAPLPRREYTKRSDYNVLRRTNRVTVTPTMWMHEEDNQKIVRTTSRDSVITEEFGKNPYTKTEADKCQVAEEWWKANQRYWKAVREAWDETYHRYPTLSLNLTKDEGAALYEKLFEMGDEASKDNSIAHAKMKQDALDVINSFVVEKTKSER